MNFEEFELATKPGALENNNQQQTQQESQVQEQKPQESEVNFDEKLDEILNLENLDN